MTRVPEPLRGMWLLGVYPTVVAGILADPAAAVQTHGLGSLLVLMTGLAVAQVWAIASELRVVPGSRCLDR